MTVGLSTRTGMRSRRGALKIGLVDPIEDPGRLAFVDTPDGVVSKIQTALAATTTKHARGRSQPPD